MVSCTEIGLRPLRVERQVELIFPAELIASFTQCVVSYLCTRVSFCQVSGMSGYLVGNDSYAYILFVG